MNNQADDAIDKALAALRDAAPPEGMNARITARLEQHAQAQSQAPASRWRALLTGQSLAAAWFRGAATGAAIALLAVAAVLALHHSSAPMAQQAAAVPDHMRSITPASAAKRETTPCAHPAVFRVATVATPHALQTVWTEDIAENTAPSRPAPVLPLTAQERELVHLVRASTPAQLAAISHESQAGPQDEQTRLSAPPPPPPTSEVPAETKPEPDAEATPESTPEAAPETEQSSPATDSNATSPANQ